MAPGFCGRSLLPGESAAQPRDSQDTAVGEARDPACNVQDPAGQGAPSPACAPSRAQVSPAPEADNVSGLSSHAAAVGRPVGTVAQ